jgi:hypothetical protein
MAYRFNPFTSQLDFYQEDTQFVSSGAIANLTSGQQDAIREGSIVTTTDGRRWAYSGTGSKTAEASYVELADITPEWSVIAGKPSTFPPSAHASSHFTSGTDALSPADIGAAAASHTHADATTTVAGFLSATDKTKLDGIAAGAEVNVQADWNATSGDAAILNKPTLGTAAAANTGDFAASSHTHAAADITSGTFGISLIPTGTTSSTVAIGDHTHTQLHDRSHAITSTSDHTAGNHKVFYSDGSGNIQELALGSSGQVLTSNGTSSAPSFATASGGITAIGTSAADALSISGSDLVADDPGADRILFWDDSADKLTHLEVGTGLSISGTTLSVTGGGSTNIWIPASAWIPRTTTGAGVDSRETTTNDQNFDELLFDAGTDEFAQALTILPNNYNLGTITARFYWTAASGSGAVVWAIQGRAFADDDALDTAFGTAQTVTDTLLAADDMHISAATSAVTIGGTPAANRPIQFQVYRDADAGGDTLAVDARLLGVEILFN